MLSAVGPSVLSVSAHLGNVVDTGGHLAAVYDAGSRILGSIRPVACAGRVGHPHARPRVACRRVVTTGDIDNELTTLLHALGIPTPTT
jgi:hypothetical protein